jgi:hypothetical protein
MNSTGSPNTALQALPSSTLLSTEGLFRLQRARLSCPKVLTPRHKVPRNFSPSSSAARCGSIFVMNPHVVSAKALNRTTTRQAGVNGRTGRGFRLQLSRAYIQGGCLTEFSTYQNHQGRIGRAQPLLASNSENCTVHDRPTRFC